MKGRNHNNNRIITSAWSDNDITLPSKAIVVAIAVENWDYFTSNSSNQFYCNSEWFKPTEYIAVSRVN